MLNTPLPRPTDLADADATRRAFLKKVAIGGAAAAIGTQVLPLRVLAQEGEDTEPAVELTPDEERVGFLAGIALAGAVVYRAATGDEVSEDDDEDEESTTAPSSTTTTLPPITVPPLAEPVVEVLRVFGSHHSQQAVALNALLTTAVTAPNGTLVAEVRDALDSSADETAVLTILRDLEERIAATHLQAIADLEDVNDAKLVATALPVVSQHAVVLGMVGPTPAPLEEIVPEEQTTDAALDEGTYPADGTTAPEDTSDEADDDANAGGEGADPGSDTTEAPADGTESNTGGAGDPESEG
ncbi:MAG TPA: twin-arginine translocation signal domain-containing protein [Iamia sp.]